MRACALWVYVPFIYIDHHILVMLLVLDEQGGLCALSSRFIPLGGDTKAASKDRSGDQRYPGLLQSRAMSLASNSAVDARQPIEPGSSDHSCRRTSFVRAVRPVAPHARGAYKGDIPRPMEREIRRIGNIPTLPNWRWRTSTS